MTAPQFTPGPWSTETNHSNTCERITADSRPDAKIAEAHSYSTHLPDKAERKANARLIAAAPELFNELTEWLFLLDSGQISGNGLHAFADKTRAALAKARGDQ